MKIIFLLSVLIICSICLFWTRNILKMYKSGMTELKGNEIMFYKFFVFSSILITLFAIAVVLFGVTIWTIGII